MADESHTDDRIWRAVEDQRFRALQHLEALAGNAVGDLFRSPRLASPFDHYIARMLARDLTALGMAVHDSAKSITTGGVWLAPCREYPGVIVAWTQHDASAAVFGVRLHRELQGMMNFDLYDVLCELGYTIKPYGNGGAHVVTAPR